jgi:hypothetical protein
MVAVAVLLAWGSALLVERPVRAGRFDGRMLTAAAGALALVVVIAVAGTPRRSDADDLLTRLAGAASPDRSDSASDPTNPAPQSTAALGPAATASASVDPIVVGWFGDSIALSLGLATSRYASTDAVRFGILDTPLGCGVALVSEFGPDPSRCAQSLPLATERIAVIGARVAAVMSCQWELMTRSIPGDPVRRTPDDPKYQRYVRDRYVRAIDTLRTAGIERVLWIACPHQSTTVGLHGLAPQYRAARDPARVDTINALVAGIAAERTDVVVVDLPEWVDPRQDDAALRPDGSHFEWERDTGVADALAAMVTEALSS